MPSLFVSSVSKLFSVNKAVLESSQVSAHWDQSFGRIVDGPWHLNDVNFRLIRPKCIRVCTLVMDLFSVIISF